MTSSSSTSPSTTAQDLFDSVPWHHPTPATPAWHKPRVPFAHNNNVLQTLDVWLPSTSTTTTTPPINPTNIPGHWLIFIHGGAWRDPAIASLNFATPTIHHLLSSPTSNSSSSSSSNSSTSNTNTNTSRAAIAGILSLSYSLSPKPSVPSTSPAEAKSRSAMHPQHILDVLSGLAFAKAVFGSAVEHNGVLMGHSCGATLALQSAMGSARDWDWASLPAASLRQSSSDDVNEKGAEMESEVRKSESEAMFQPQAMLLLCGIYDLPLLVAPTSPGFAAYAPIYREIVLGAFGSDECVWRRASPANHDGFMRTWKKGGSIVVVADSGEDGLVPPEQGEGIVRVLEGQGWKRDYEGEGKQGAKERVVHRVELKGSHDEIWEDGGQIARVIEDLLGRLNT